jgi:hypothetical protein
MYSYHKTIRKVIVAFGDFFNQIKLTRYTQEGVEVETFLVPIIYGPKEKYVSRLESDPLLDKKVQVTLPMLSYEMTDMSYDAARKLNTNYRNRHSQPDVSCSGEHDVALSVYNPVPFDFDFSLYLYVRNFEDSAQIIEKILPYFTPDYTINVNLVEELGIIKEVPIVFKSISHDIEYEGDYNSKIRTIIWTLNFTVKAYIYGAIREPKIIRTAITNIYDDNTLADRNIIFTMCEGVGYGWGDYKIGEKVYQGYSLDTSTSTGTVVGWNTDSKLLEISFSHGHFITGTPLIGISSGSKWNVCNVDLKSNKLVQTIITSSPTDACGNNDYIYTTYMFEYPDFPETITTSSDFSGDLPFELGKDDLQIQNERVIDLLN